MVFKEAGAWHSRARFWRGIPHRAGRVRGSHPYVLRLRPYRATAGDGLLVSGYWLSDVGVGLAVRRMAFAAAHGSVRAATLCGGFGRGAMELSRG